MQFKTSEIHFGYRTVKFTGNIFKLKVTESFELSFERVGGKYLPEDSTAEYSLWSFPNHVSDDTITVIIQNTCFECGGLMKDSTAFQNTLISHNDFGNDVGERGTTQSRTGQAKEITVRKCTQCGHSHT